MPKKESYGCPVKKIKIGGMDYDIHFSSQEVSKALEEMGKCSSATLDITISRGLKNAQVVDTFIHEVMHGIFYVLAMDWEEGDDRKVPDFETVTRAVASGFTMIFRDNPVFILWLLHLLTNNSELEKCINKLRTTEDESKQTE
jgi:hypothetical protein